MQCFWARGVGLTDRWMDIARVHARTHTHTHTHTRLMALFPGLPRWAGTRKVKPIWILLKQETVSGISWATCKSAPRSRQITTPAPHHSVFLQVGCPSCHPTNSVKALKAHGQSQHWDIIIRAHYMCITMHNELVSLAKIYTTTRYQNW